jgi:hypothetical protein
MKGTPGKQILSSCDPGPALTYTCRMCLQPSAVRPYQRWHWAGDEIVPDPIIPASRVVPGTGKKHYPIDIREYLSIEDNAVIRHTLRRLVRGLKGTGKARFFSRHRGAFDFRALTVASLVGGLAYVPSGRGFDHWLFPDETLANGGGDCEDLAFLLAALLEASGISSYCLRVALGTVIDYSDPGAPRRWDHAWVVYFNEGGAWEILEPLNLAAPRRGAAVAPQVKDFEYVPHFVFNRHHLWRVRSTETAANRAFDEYVADRQFWEGYNPSFAAAVHADIFDEALAGMPRSQLLRVKAASTLVDVNVLDYDPRDHFDFAYVDEAWQRVGERLSSGNLSDLALAGHAIGDFYAHTFYAHFAERTDPATLVLYDPSTALPKRKLVYDFAPFAPLPGCTSSVADAESTWKGRLISGQWWRWYATFPNELERAADFSSHRGLPDHDAVAVDGPAPKPAHRLYADPQEYARQFDLRRKAAVEHIRAVYQRWRNR